MYQRPRSQVWTYFKVTDEVKQIAMCQICGRCLCYKSSTGNLKKHLMGPHSIEFPSVTESVTSSVRKAKRSAMHLKSSSNEFSKSENISHANETDEALCTDNDDPEMDLTLSQIRPSSKVISYLKASPNKVQRSHKNEEHEFDLFCKSLAVQLKKMPLDRALVCQEKLQSVMIQERLDHLKVSSNMLSNAHSGHTYNLVLSDSQYTSTTSTQTTSTPTVVVPTIYKATIIHDDSET